MKFIGLLVDMFIGWYVRNFRLRLHPAHRFSFRLV